MSEFNVNYDIDANPGLFTQQFLASYDHQPDGILKTASSAATLTTRRKLREDSFAADIIPFDEVNNGDLHPMLDSEHPAILCEMESDQFGAKTISFNDTGDTAPFYGDKYLLTFHSNTTPEWTKDVNLLRTYKGDIREMITDNSLRDLSRRKDVKVMSEVDAIVGTEAGKPSDYTGHIQNIAYPGRLNRQNWVSCKQLIPDRDLLNGVFLCNRRTFSEFERWEHDEMGGEKSQEFALKGVAALEKAHFGGIDFIVTMKTDLVPNGVIYQFTKPNYLGRAGTLMKPTMYVKKDKDILRFSCREMIGFAFANMGGLQKVSFQDITGPTGGDGRIEL